MSSFALPFELEQPWPERSYVTISIDDGHPSDLRTADLLASVGLPATFYVPAANPERPVLQTADIRMLAQQFEIGGHGLSHRRLTVMSIDEAHREIVECKQWLESVTGHPPAAFCYPGGKFNSTIASLVKQAGFLGARTCRLNLNVWPRDPFTWGVSTQAYSHAVGIQLRHAVWEGNWRGAVDFFHVYGAATDWERHFLRGLERVEAAGGVAHLYLHSWEIDERDEWQKLRRVFAAIAGCRNVQPVTNGDLFRLWHLRHDRA